MPCDTQQNRAMTRVSFKNATSAERDVENRTKKRAAQESNTSKEKKQLNGKYKTNCGIPSVASWNPGIGNQE